MKKFIKAKEIGLYTLLFAVGFFIGTFILRPPVPNLAPEATPAVSDVEVTEELTVSLGEFRITVYTPYCDGGVWGYQTATGVKSEGLKTCAVDPSVIPLGTTILVDGICLKAVDTGSAVKGNVIDIFYDGTKEEATEWLSQIGTVHEVYEVK